MTILTKGKMLESASGKGGGYRLIKQPSEYKVIDILHLIEGNLAPVACLCEGGKSVRVPQSVPHFRSGRDWKMLSMITLRNIHSRI